jgi:hypothetical protein
LIEIDDGIGGGGASAAHGALQGKGAGGVAPRCQKVCWPTSQAENSCQARLFVGNEGCARVQRTCVGEAATPCRCMASTSENCVPQSTCARMNRALQSRARRMAHAAGLRGVRRWCCAHRVDEACEQQRRRKAPVKAAYSFVARHCAQREVAH